MNKTILINLPSPSVFGFCLIRLELGVRYVYMLLGCKIETSQENNPDETPSFRRDQNFMKDPREEVQFVRMFTCS